MTIFILHRFKNHQRSKKMHQVYSQVNKAATRIAVAPSTKLTYLTKLISTILRI